MSFVLNGQPRAWQPELTLEALLRQEGYIANIPEAPQSDAGSCTVSIRAGVAVAIGQQVVPRSTWAQRLVAPEDEVELFQAIAGG